MSETDDRHQGIDFGDFDDRLEDFDYPVSLETVLEECGDLTLDLPKGETTVEEVLERGGDDTTYDSPDAVRNDVLNRVGSDAVSPEGYSDRGTGEDST